MTATANQQLDRTRRDPWLQAEPPALRGKPIHAPAIGLIELAVETVMAAEILAFCPAKETGLYTRGIEFDGVTTIEGLARMEEHLRTASALLPASEWMHAIVYGCTSGSVVIGQEKVEELIHNERPGIPVVTPIGAVLEAIRALGVSKLTVVTPYVEEVNRRFSEVLETNGVTIASGRAFGLSTGDEMFRMPASAFLDAAIEANSEDAEAIFISCTGIITSPIVRELEQRTAKPVITSNQAIAWQCREIAGVAPTQSDIGVLFKHRLETVNA